MSTHYDSMNLLGSPRTAARNDFEHGYNQALEQCLDIAQDADAEIEELLGLIEEILDGGFHSLNNWADEAKRVSGGIRIRRRA